MSTSNTLPSVILVCSGGHCRKLNVGSYLLQKFGKYSIRIKNYMYLLTKLNDQLNCIYIIIIPFSFGFNLKHWGQRKEPFIIIKCS